MSRPVDLGVSTWPSSAPWPLCALLRLGNRENRELVGDGEVMGEMLLFSNLEKNPLFLGCGGACCVCCLCSSFRWTSSKASPSASSDVSAVGGSCSKRRCRGIRGNLVESVERRVGCASRLTTGDRAEISCGQREEIQVSNEICIQAMCVYSGNSTVTYKRAAVRVKRFPRNAEWLNLAKFALGIGGGARQVATRPRGLLLSGGWRKIDTAVVDHYICG